MGKVLAKYAGDEGNNSKTNNNVNNVQPYDRVTAKGAENGLFRACMKTLRQSHSTGNRIRLVLVVAGLFTDQKIYREVISCFYLLTKHLESALEKNKDNAICAKLLHLGYNFTPQYEEDLKFLYAKDKVHWPDAVGNVLEYNSALKDYIHKIDEACQMGDPSTLAGATFVLWGALIIGGGAVAKPRVESAFGPNATHLFQQVTGPGREARKKAFIETWDSLAVVDNPQFQRIVDASNQCMKGNNDVMTSISKDQGLIDTAV